MNIHYSTVHFVVEMAHDIRIQSLRFKTKQKKNWFEFTIIYLSLYFDWVAAYRKHFEMHSTEIRTDVQWLSNEEAPSQNWKDT